MLSFLFPRLTPARTRVASRGAALFEALVFEARRPHWYVEGQVADTVDGRFAVIATIAALATVRLERGGDAGQAAAVALAERFVEAMDAEHRQMGVGDPALGRTVRKLVAGLGRRVDLWRRAVDGGTGWDDAAASSLFGRSAPAAGALAHCVGELRTFQRRLDAASDEALGQGRIG